MHDGSRTASGPSEWRSGWRLVLAATIGIAIAGGHYHVVGAMLRPLSEAYGWTRGEIAFALTISSIIGPFSNLVVGMLADRFGPRPVILWGTGLFALAYALFGLSGPALWTWYAASVIYAILGHFVSPIVWTMAIVRHFREKRGLALAVSLSGTGILVAGLPTAVLTLVEAWGVRVAFFAWAGLGGALMFFPAFFLFKQQPSDDLAAGKAPVTGVAQSGVSVGEALSNPRFFQLAIALLVVAATIGVFIVHAQPMLVDSGLSPAQAATVALGMGPMMIIGRLGTGFLFDRLPTSLVAAIAFAVPALCSGMLLGLDGSMTWAFVCAGLAGLGMGAEVDVVAYLTSRYFGGRSYGILFGILIGLYGMGIAAGSTVAGAIFDRTGSYDLALIAATIGCSIASLLVATLGSPAPGPSPEELPA